MITFLFWNLNRRPLFDRVARIVAGRGVDVVLLAECTAERPLPAGALAEWAELPELVPGKVRWFSRWTASRFVERHALANGRLVVREVRPPSGDPLLLGAAHLTSKAGGWTDAAQASAARNCADVIEQVETKSGITRTLLIGDLNMPPFAPGMIDGFGLHALMTRDLAVRHSQRTSDGHRCRRTFFNPMWRFLTDRGARPAGTFYWPQATPDNHFWYALDQVLVRPELADKIVHIEIVETDGTRSLLAPTGRPDAVNGSDHLPVMLILYV